MARFSAQCPVVEALRIVVRTSDRAPLAVDGIGASPGRRHFRLERLQSEIGVVGGATSTRCWATRMLEMRLSMKLENTNANPSKLDRPIAISASHGRTLPPQQSRVLQPANGMHRLSAKPMTIRGRLRRACRPVRARMPAPAVRMTRRSRSHNKRAPAKDGGVYDRRRRRLLVRGMFMRLVPQRLVAGGSERSEVGLQAVR